MNKLAVLVVLYDCEPEKSASYLKLTESANSNSDISVCFWNNGPKGVLLDTNISNIQLIETLNNISLAKIYNTFIESYKAENYFILDHDTFINETYLDELMMTNFFGVSIPNISSNGKLYYPIIKKSYSPFSKAVIANSNIYKLNKVKVFLSIGSGICINNKMVAKFKFKFGSVFDERFYIYGVDTTFFVRLKKVNNSRVQVANNLEHSLSRIDEKEFSLFRFQERAIENVLLFRLYPSIFSFFRVIKFFIKNRNSLNLKIIKMLILSYAKGKHPNNG